MKLDICIPLKFSQEVEMLYESKAECCAEGLLPVTNTCSKIEFEVDEDGVSISGGWSLVPLTCPTVRFL